MVIQPRWGVWADAWGARAVLGISGLGASLAPLLWIAVPIPWGGVPVEMLAAGCWLGHLLSVALYSMELAPDEASRSVIVAQATVAQGIGAALASLAAVALVGATGPVPVLVLSGLVCLGATAVMGGTIPRSWVHPVVPRRPLGPLLFRRSLS